jgi:putative ATP-dependent endonuclease of OLD family
MVSGVARIRFIDIRNFRCLKELTWAPSPGLNCLIGPGDSGKSSILDAIDYCLGARRTISFSDADFYDLAVSEPIAITITIGELEDELKSMETYGNYLRSFDPETYKIDDEPESGRETVLSLRLMVKSDLEPVWTLVSERAEAQGQPRYLTWADRLRLCPTRIGAFAENDLAWRRGSVLTKLSDEKAETSGALAEAARTARNAFGDLAEKQLTNTLTIVAKTARGLGIDVGEIPKALLDAHSVSFSGGTISLHNAAGIPLRRLGTGSTRLLAAGLQREAANGATVILIDEVEHGLEPHRIRRLLHSLGAKDTSPPLQGFLTTHSPIVLREMSAEQLVRLRRSKDKHIAEIVGSKANIQGTLRRFPEAFLAASVIVCEGASEVGLIRGLDQYDTAEGQTSMFALGVELVDAGGCDNIYPRANAFRSMGYRVTVLRDDDKRPNALIEGMFAAQAGPIHKWRNGKALEDELFDALPDGAVAALLEYAIELHGEGLVAAHIKATSKGQVALAMACATKASPWFKNVTAMEHIGREIVGPIYGKCEAGFRKVVDDLFTWIDNG